MEADLFLWLLMMLYFHIVRYFEICHNTSVYDLRTYVKYGGKIIYIIVFTQIMIFVVFEILKNSPL